MPKQPPSTSPCVEHPSIPTRGRRLAGTEAVVIIVVVTAAAVLVALAGLPGPQVLMLLAGAGLVAGATIALSTRLSLGGARVLLRSVLAAV
ncbi:hypothetical protein [Streptomyces sp. YS-3]|uniref:hypothetical protein n=1 Tax=Streptomyces sp. YS-3 TaxID=3381352 RepID=UPI00386267CC